MIRRRSRDFPPIPTHLVFVSLLLSQPLVHVLLCPRPVQAGTASPHPFTEYQPDNITAITLYIRGDEDFAYYVDEEGYTVVRDPDGWLVYADTGALTSSSNLDVDLDGTGSPDNNYYGGLVPSRIRVGYDSDSPSKSGIQRGLMPSYEHLSALQCGGTTDCDEWHDINYNYPIDNDTSEQQQYHRQTRFRSSLGPPGSSQQSNIRTVGTFTNLVVLLRFAHSKQTKSALPTRQEIGILMNSQEPDARIAPTGSVYSAYQEYSYGRVNIKSSIAPWVRVRRTERSSSDRSNFKKALYQALSLLKRRNRIDARNYDAVTVLHSGYGAEHGSTDCHGTKSEDRIWAHSGSLNWMGQSIRYGVSSSLWGSCGAEIARVGMIAHELGHSLFRLPDLYDKGRGSGVGAFDLMAYAWGMDNSQYSPPHPCAWSKAKLNWVLPTEVKKAGRYILYPSETNPIVYRIDGGYPQDEYLLVEYRKDIGFDKALGCDGAVIYHCDDTAARQSRPGFPRMRGPSRWPTNGDHYQIAIAQRDRRFDLEKGENTGECDDIWGQSNGLDDVFGPGDNVFNFYPNSDSYQGGIIRKTGIQIYSFEKTSRRLKFTVTGTYLGRDRPTTRSEDERGRNNPVKQRGNNKNNKNCRDDDHYIYKSSSGATYTCADAKDSKHICRRKDQKTGHFFWERCKATCRSLFLKQERHATDICAS